MEYALIKSGKVENVIVADDSFVAEIAADWDHIERIDTPEERALGVGIGWGWDGTKFVPPTTEAQPEPEWAWYLDIGPFSDRLGNKAYAVDTSTDPFVQSFNRDLSRRKWVDLKDQRVAVALGYLAGQTIPGIGTISSPVLTPAEVSAILTTPVAPSENLALRKLYFS